LKTISIIINLEKDEKLLNTINYLKILVKYNFDIWLENLHKEIVLKYFNELDFDSENRVNFSSKIDIIKRSDLVIIIGGDGTILRHFVDIIKFRKPIFGINHGTLGFISQAEKNDDVILNEFFLGNFIVDSRMILEAKIQKYKLKNKNGNKTKTKTEKLFALNEVVVNRSNFSKIINMNLFVGGKKAAFYSADGIIISTPTGSTAYSLSAGGPVLHPNVNAIVITPICPHTLSARSFVVPDNKKIQIFASLPVENNITVCVDGKEGKFFVEECCVEIVKSRYKANFVKLKDSNFFEIFRKKFSSR
jgi:NAD+ kinase